MRKFDRLQRLYALHALMVDIATDEAKLARFTMGFWAATDFDLRLSNVHEAKMCNTKHCALGSAGFTPFFQARGLSTHNYYFRRNLHVSFEGVYDFDAGQKFFGITKTESRNLFNPDFYDDEHDPLLVAKRVVKLIKKYHAYPVVTHSH
jgi:hypothetical protein